jgi:1,4-alpha-glucan branching enzyme
MGGEFGQAREWTHEGQLDWYESGQPLNNGIQRWIGDLNALLRREPALHQLDFDGAGFEWIDNRDADTSVLAFVRRARNGRPVLVACNFTPVPRTSYGIGVPFAGYWREILNSDAPPYGGSGMGNFGGLHTSPVPAQGRFHSLSLTLPPLAIVFFAPEP